MKDERGKDAKGGEVKLPEAAFEIDAHMACPDCGEKPVRLGVKASTTVWFDCRNPKCTVFGKRRPPEELQ